MSDTEQTGEPQSIACGEMTFDFGGLIQLLAGHLRNDKKLFIRELIQNAHDDSAFERDRRYTACAELCRRQPHRHNLHLRDEARILFLDYRLACLRHAAGLPPVDDLFCRQPDDLTRLDGRRARIEAIAAPLGLGQQDQSRPIE